jgi:hypothetical protein
VVDELADIARAVRRISPSWRDPEPFHLAKSEISAALFRLARRLGHRPAILRPAAPPRPTAASLRVTQR